MFYAPTVDEGIKTIIYPFQGIERIYERGTLDLIVAKVGITKNLKKVEFPLIKRKLIFEDERRVLEKIRMLGQQKWKEAEVRVKKITESLNNKLMEKYKLLLAYKTKKAEEKKEIKNKIKMLGYSIRMEYKIWSKICNKILTKS